MSDKPIQITENDLKRLKRLLEEAQHGEYRGSPYLGRPQSGLDRAKVISYQKVSQEVVAMNSTVVLQNIATEEETYTLVFPDRADISAGRISVLAPIGTAMLGYRVGDIFEWEVPAGRRKLKVKRIIYQPEAAGDYHL